MTYVKYVKPEDLAMEMADPYNAKVRLKIIESSFIGASPNKEYFDNLLYGVEPMSPLWFELVQVKGSAEYAEWMKINKPEVNIGAAQREVHAYFDKQYEFREMEVVEKEYKEALDTATNGGDWKWEWYGEFKRTRHEVLQIMEPILIHDGHTLAEAHKFVETMIDFPKLYNEKDLV